MTVLSGIVVVIFAFVGAEIVTIAAAESDEPERAVARATNAVVWRVLVFYVLACRVVVAIVPWNEPSSATRRSSPRSTRSASRARRTS